MAKPATGKSVQSEERRDSDGFKYKGVRKRKWGKFVSEIRLPNCRDRIWLGSYDSAEKAARAFDAAQVCLRGCSARLNFPGSSSLEIPSRPLTHQDIQMIASQFANSGPAAQPPLPGTASEDSSELSRDRSDSGRVSPDSPSHSISAGSSLEDSTSGTTFMDLLVESGPECYKPLDYGIFPGFDDFTNDFFHQTVPIAEFGDEKFDDLSEFFLWNY